MNDSFDSTGNSFLPACKTVGLLRTDLSEQLMPSCRDVDIATGVFRCAKMLGDVALDHREAAVGQLVQRCRQDIALPAGGIG